MRLRDLRTSGQLPVPLVLASGGRALAAAPDGCVARAALAPAATLSTRAVSRSDGAGAELRI